RSHYVHDMVAAAFLGPKPEGHHVNHRDSDRTNNLPSNLEYVTPQGNVDHCLRVGRFHHGARTGGAKLTDAMVVAIRASDESRVVLGKRYGITAKHIDELRRGRGWNHLKGQVSNG